MLPRCSGVLLHVTSLPGPFGIGDLGPEAFSFVDFLSRAGQKVWQVLPLGPTTTGNSPYTTLSTFAGNPALISLSRLVEEGLLVERDLNDIPHSACDEVDFEEALRSKTSGAARAFERFQTVASASQLDGFAEFSHDNHWWLGGYAIFAALRAAHGGAHWNTWEPELLEHRPDAIQHWTNELAHSVQLAEFTQYLFFRQWRDLKRYAHDRGVRIFGDVPFFVAGESADVWLHQDQFQLDAESRPTVVSGVPPDYFSETGQLWGDPLYRWDRMASTGYAWWIKRLRHALTMFDLVRLDHFRGFEAYWEVPATEKTAARGRWAKGPGKDLFQALMEQTDELAIVVEDLGLITPEVDALRDELGFPGMRVLQFAFDDGASAYHRPDSYSRNCVVYTGTHDNDTVVGWFRNMNSATGSGETVKAQDLVLRYVGTEGREIHWDLIRLALASVADLAIFPLQDLLGLGSEARMNTPGEPDGNWTWRYRREMLTPEIAHRLRELSETNERVSN
ncbi:MAG: 4-alpha-glucanotransferase [Planctomycetota bacterium]